MGPKFEEKYMNFNNAPNFSESRKIIKKIINKGKKNSIRKIDKPFLIYGAGNLGKMAIEYFEIIGKIPDLIIDKSFHENDDGEFYKVKKGSIDNLKIDLRRHYLIIVTIVNTSYTEIHEFLSEKGFFDIVPFYDVTEAYKDIHPLSNGWVLEDFDNNDFEKTNCVLKYWSDNHSRAHHLQFIAWHRLREDWIFKDSEIEISNRYFINEVTDILTDNESFLDVGAHQGEITQKFIKTNKSYNKIWLIEPDEFNYNEIYKNIIQNESLIKKNITLIKNAVSDNKNNKLFYEGLGYSSQFSVFGNSKIEVITIDELDINPTFIKMHLEGWELLALKGALNTILVNKPILALTSYHNSQGVWEIPYWLMNLKINNLSFYKYYFRLHGWCGTGGVIYCIPNL
jgi:FkbM family methyltransferase